MSDVTTPGPSRRRWWATAGSVALAAVVSVCLGIGFGRAVSSTRSLESPGLDHQYRLNLAQLSCLLHQVERAVPKGSAVYTGGDDTTASQRESLTESVTPWALSTGPTTARYHLVLTRGPCSGEGITATRTVRP